MLQIEEEKFEDLDATLHQYIVEKPLMEHS